MLCGTGLIRLAKNAEEKYYGQVVRIASGKKGDANFTTLTGNVPGDFRVSERTVGSKELSDNAVIFDNGKQIALSSLTSNVIKEAQIKYARTNWAGKIDLLVLNCAKDEIFGRVFWEVERIPVIDEDGNPTGDVEYEESLGITFGNGEKDRVGPFNMKYDVRTGDYAAVKINRGGTGFSSLIKLTELKNVTENAWIGKEAVTFGGQTYSVPTDVLCYNVDSQDWVTLDQALAYSDSANLYVKDGVVRVVEVQH